MKLDPKWRLTDEQQLALLNKTIESIETEKDYKYDQAYWFQLIDPVNGLSMARSENLERFKEYRQERQTLGVPCNTACCVAGHMAINGDALGYQFDPKHHAPQICSSWLPKYEIVFHLLFNECFRHMAGVKESKPLVLEYLRMLRDGVSQIAVLEAMQTDSRLSSRLCAWANLEVELIEARMQERS